MKKQAFTLAEVLITLGIIGVVAAMTIPTLMTKTNEAEFKTAFKKTLSALNQAITMNVALDYVDWASATKTTTTASDSFYSIINKRMHVISTATTANTVMGIGTGNYTIFFADGMVVSFPQTAKECTEANSTTTSCKGVIDVNGTRGPNTTSNCGGNSTTDCTAENLNAKDQYGIRFQDQQVLPNGKAAKYVLFN